VVRAKHAVSLLQSAFGEKVEIVVADAAAEAVGIMYFDFMIEKAQFQTARRRQGLFTLPNVETVGIFTRQRNPFRAIVD
jgi:hypothetical protein